MSNKFKYGILLTTFNDFDMSKVMHETLEPCIIKANEYFGNGHCMVTVDAGSSDESIDFWKQHGHVIHKDNSNRELKHLSVALNSGIDYLIDNDCNYLIWVHADMKFDEDEKWIIKLINKIDKHPDIGKIHPECFRNGQKLKFGDRPGNSCPWVIKKDVFLMIDERRKQTGIRTRPIGLREYFFERFIGIGGREDWDLNNNILDLGFKVMITSDTIIWHKGMGTRESRDTRREAYTNFIIYYSIYKTYDARV